MKHALKLEISNTRNDDVTIEWFFFETTEEMEVLEAEKKKEEEDWPKQSGVVSIRYYYFQKYLVADLLELELGELQGMKLKHIAQLIK